MQSGIQGPIFLKESSNMKEQVREIQALLKEAPPDVKADVEERIRPWVYGILGEDNIAFELKNSFLPMIVLRDLHLVHEGNAAQIDFLVITNKFNLIIECKNLYGDIEVTPKGDFIRKTTYGGKTKKEGIYSPITQNQRHLMLMKSLRKESKSNTLIKWMVNKYFEEGNIPLVVLANPKTILHMSKAPKEIQDQIIRHDQLAAHIRKRLKESKEPSISEEQMQRTANFYLEKNEEKTDQGLEEIKTMLSAKAYVRNEETQNAEVDAEALTLALKAYRMEKSKEEGIKAFYVFTNAQMEEFIQTNPQSLDDLRQVTGFKDVKCDKYGEDLLKILNQFR